jgi:hypothetical protein
MAMASGTAEPATPGPARLFIASTPMIALSCAAAALANPGRCQLVLIEDFDLAGRLQDLLRGWRDNPFEVIERLPGRYTEYLLGADNARRGISGLLHRVHVKRSLRAQTLAAVRDIERRLTPAEIWLGNDRKPETQLALHLASTRMGRRVGRYLDDGLYTYLGDVRQRPLIRRIDAMVKSVAYGTWWQRVSQAGTSRWIAESWLAFPDEALDRSPQRVRRALPRGWFARREFIRLGLRAAQAFDLSRRGLRDLATVVVLPHSNQMRANPGLIAALRALIASSHAERRTVAVKYHPRETGRDVGDLLSGEVVGLPGMLPLELLLPLLPVGIELVGEGSTALLAAKWLRPDLRVSDLGLSRAGYALRARTVFSRHGIPVRTAP